MITFKGTNFSKCLLSAVFANINKLDLFVKFMP